MSTPDPDPNAAPDPDRAAADPAGAAADPAGAAADPDVAAGAAPVADPWKSFRGIMAATLILEAIVVLLALPVVSAAHGGLTLLSGGFLIGMAVLMVLMCGVQGRPGIIWVNFGLQFVLVAGALIHGGIGFIGVIFAVVWALFIYLRSEVKRRQDRGLLPSQQQKPD